MFKLFAILFLSWADFLFWNSLSPSPAFFFFLISNSPQCLFNNIYKNLKYCVKYYIPEIWKPEICYKTFKTCPLLSGILWETLKSLLKKM